MPWFRIYGLLRPCNIKYALHKASQNDQKNILEYTVCERALNSNLQRRSVSNFQSQILNRYFSVNIDQYFSVFTDAIPEKKSVGIVLEYVSYNRVRTYSSRSLCTYCTHTHKNQRGREDEKKESGRERREERVERLLSSMVIDTFLFTIIFLRLLFSTLTHTTILRR